MTGGPQAESWGAPGRGHQARMHPPRPDDHTME